MSHRSSTMVPLMDNARCSHQAKATERSLKFKGKGEGAEQVSRNEGHPACALTPPSASPSACGVLQSPTPSQTGPKLRKEGAQYAGRTKVWGELCDNLGSDTESVGGLEPAQYPKDRGEAPRSGPSTSTLHSV